MDDSMKRPDASEPESVRTTIVGARPPAVPAGTGRIPRGIEILLKKASVDADFRELLLARRSAAAVEIQLQLDPAEKMMLDAIPAEHLRSAIASAKVTAKQRLAFLGKAAVVMLAALSTASSLGCDKLGKTRGISPDRPPQQQPEKPEPAPKDNGEPKAEADQQVQPSQDVAGLMADTPAPPVVVTGIAPDRPEPREEEAAPAPAMPVAGATANMPQKPAEQLQPSDDAKKDEQVVPKPVRGIRPDVPKKEQEQQ